MDQDTLDFSDVAKCILIFWCRFAFIALGFVDIHRHPRDPARCRRGVGAP
jgi:hypothetical protein